MAVWSPLGVGTLVENSVTSPVQFPPHLYWIPDTPVVSNNFKVQKASPRLWAHPHTRNMH